MKKSIGFSVVTMIFVFLPSVAAQSLVRERSIQRDSAQEVAVYLFPHQLNSDDRLADGESGRSFRLGDKTFLIWIDLEPGARFTHPTAYVLISVEGTQVEEGVWWPVLNGRKILHGNQNTVAVNSPFQFKSLDRPIDVYFYSEGILPGDSLCDGPDDREIPVLSKSFLAWVDMHPGLFFAHPTQYLLIGADKTIRVVDGNWWPELNGKVMLYGTRDKYSVLSPFRLTDWH
jgi:hypothetical protein